MIKSQPYKLKNTIQQYKWGTRGKNAFIPKLLNIKAEKDKPSAEIWMGAHPKASSKITIGGKETDLAEVIRHYPIEMLGSRTAKRFSNTLPFLFKVLSANEALSVQVHPNKKQAVLLNKKDPVNYPDANHKHEIAVALDSLTALVGFKSFRQIIKTLKEYPEIREIIGSDKKSTKSIIELLIKKSITHKDEIKRTIVKLNERIKTKKNPTEIEKHFLKPHKKYGYDFGVLLLFFLNLVHLKKGEAIFTKPGIPHAYLKGNILECMSNSDNVIRAGLTPKFKDVNSLLKVLTYDLASPQILNGSKKVVSVIYKTDAKEFEIQLFTTRKKELSFESESGPRILLVLEGAIKFVFMNDGEIKSEKILRGKSIFLPSILSDFRITSEKNSRFVLVSVPA